MAKLGRKKIDDNFLSSRRLQLVTSNAISRPFDIRININLKNYENDVTGTAKLSEI